MFDSFFNEVNLGQTWNANASPFLQGIATSMFGASMTLEYKAAGLMFESVLNGTLNSNTAQWAMWGLFSTFSSQPGGGLASLQCESHFCLDRSHLFGLGR
jgi:hypothetical protein